MILDELGKEPINRFWDRRVLRICLAPWVCVDVYSAQTVVIMATFRFSVEKKGSRCPHDSAHVFQCFDVWTCHLALHHPIFCIFWAQAKPNLTSVTSEIHGGPALVFSVHYFRPCTCSPAWAGGFHCPGLALEGSVQEIRSGKIGRRRRRRSREICEIIRRKEEDMVPGDRVLVPPIHVYRISQQRLWSRPKERHLQVERYSKSGNLQVPDTCGSSIRALLACWSFCLKVLLSSCGEDFPAGVGFRCGGCRPHQPSALPRCPDRHSQQWRMVLQSSSAFEASWNSWFGPPWSAGLFQVPSLAETCLQRWMWTDRQWNHWKHGIDGCERSAKPCHPPQTCADPCGTQSPGSRFDRLLPVVRLERSQLHSLEECCTELNVLSGSRERMCNSVLTPEQVQLVLKLNKYTKAKSGTDVGGVFIGQDPRLLWTADGLSEFKHQMERLFRGCPKMVTLLTPNSWKTTQILHREEFRKVGSNKRKWLKTKKALPLWSR